MDRPEEERRASYLRALERVSEEEPLSVDELDALSMLEGPALAEFEAVWRRLPAGARARLLRGLRAAAEDRLRLDYSSLNHLGLDDDDPDVRLAAVDSALEDRSPWLLEKLLELVREDPSAAVRLAAAEDLARFALLAELDDLDAESGARLRTRLLETLRREEEGWGVRGSALAALGYLTDPAVMHELDAAFLNPELRLGAVRGMGRSADPRWTDRLMPVLGSEDPVLRLEAARALGEIEDERALTPLIEAVDDPDRAVRLAVIRALGEIGGEEAREALLYLLEEPDEEIREAAERAIGALEFYEDPLGL